MEMIDWVVLFGYAAMIIAIGLRASRGVTTAEGHLRANRSLPAWAVVFSVLATEISAATYIGVPETGFKSNWNYMQFAIGALLGKAVLSKWFIRLYWRLNLTTVYGLLGQRIGPGIQKASAWAFLAGRLVASGVRLFIAALAFNVVTGIDLTVAIVCVAAIATLYTFIGGLKAVVWTDVCQGIVFSIGAATAIGVGLWKLNTPIGDLVRAASEAGKFQFITFDSGEASWLTSLKPLPVAILGGFFLVLATHGTDQENVQQLLGTKSEKASGRSILASGLVTFPIVALFLSVGTMLWAFHRKFPPTAYSASDTARIFPNFIYHELPMGIRGVVFAGLFAAAISSLGATVNAATTAWMSDVNPKSEAESAKFRRIRLLTCVFGALLALIALFFAWYAKDSRDDLVQIALGAMTILYGGILGVFLSALLFRTRGSDASTLAGLCAGVACGALLFFHRQILNGVGPKFLPSFQELKDPLLVWPYFIPISATVTLAVAALGTRNPSIGQEPPRVAA